jgi:hypothetical protein
MSAHLVSKSESADGTKPSSPDEEPQDKRVEQPVPSTKRRRFVLRAWKPSVADSEMFRWVREGPEAGLHRIYPNDVGDQFPTHLEEAPEPDRIDLETGSPVIEEGEAAPSASRVKVGFSPSSEDLAKGYSGLVAIYLAIWGDNKIRPTDSTDLQNMKLAAQLARKERNARLEQELKTMIFLQMQKEYGNHSSREGFGIRLPFSGADRTAPYPPRDKMEPSDPMSFETRQAFGAWKALAYLSLKRDRGPLARRVSEEELQAAEEKWLSSIELDTEWLLSLTRKPPVDDPATPESRET